MGTQLKQAVGSLEKAKADNLALVERLRYVQGYKALARSKGALLAVSLLRIVTTQQDWQPLCGASEAVAMCSAGIDFSDRPCYRAHTGKFSMP